MFKLKATLLSGVQAAERAMPSIKAALRAAAVGILAFAFGGGSIFGVISPFAVAFAAALPINYIPTAAIGAVISLLLFAPRAAVGFQIASLFAVIAARYLFNRLYDKKLKPALISLIAFCGALLPVIVRVQLASYTKTDMLLLGIEVVLTGCFAYFYAICSDGILIERSDPTLSYVQLLASSVLFVTAVCSCSAISFLNVNVGVILGVTAVCLVTYRYGIIGASISSILTAIALTLYSPEFMEFAGILIIAGFLAGAFSPVGKAAQLASLVFISFVCTLLLGAPSMLVYRVIDMLIAVIINVLLPKRLLGNFEIANNGGISGALSRSNAEARLDFAGKTVADFSENLLSISQKFEQLDGANIASITDSASEAVCKNCSRALECWDCDGGETRDFFNNLLGTLKTKGRVTEADFPKPLADVCCKPTTLTNALNSCYSAFLSRRAVRRQIDGSRELVFEQLSSLSETLCEMGGEIGKIGGYDESAARRVTAAFTKLADAPTRVLCTIGSGSRMTVEIYTDFEVSTPEDILCEAVCDACDRIFDLPDIASASGVTRIAFFEKARFKAEISTQQCCEGNNSVCGDSFESFCDGGCSYFVLSDGMGAGPRAAIDSVMTCSLAAKLIKAGFGVQSAVKLINSALSVKSTDETLSTLDLLRIDLYTGDAVIYKAGAAASYARIDNEVSRIDSSALPIGLLRRAECEEIRLSLKAGDALVLCSDGAVANGEAYITEALKIRPLPPPQELAEQICAAAKEIGGEKRDDITVAVIKLSRER